MLKYFKKTYSDEDKRLYRFLRKNRLMSELSNEELAKLQPYIYVRSYNENEVVYFSNDPSHALYIVKKGVVSLNLEIGGEFEKLLILRNGSVFGENAILSKAKRRNSAIVLGEGTELYVIPSSNIFEVMEHHPSIQAKMMTGYAQLCDEFTAKLFDAYKSNRGFFELNTVYS
ncbi:cyclic nucleotide-binding domain-containing protein [Marinoscillum sp. MHG1-6]|uniref:cyclic nucleotide-binding domain-containing protein n=1 Tax=Marinoscillum sp. MHG1-6 TaxID=2959627 RepID=UPI002157352E|nr:cyclic nucleotide-binding domain-containing protein [Marinoscillum sp. MHG1-6]